MAVLAKAREPRMFLDKLPEVSIKITVEPTPVAPILIPVKATDEPKLTLELRVSKEMSPFDIFNELVVPVARVQFWAWRRVTPAVSKTRLPEL